MQSLKADKEHEPTGNREHAVDPRHFDPRKRNRSLVAHLLREGPSIVEKHNLESQDEELGDNVGHPSGVRHEPIYHQVKSDMSATVRGRHRSVEGQPDQQVGSELVIPGKRCAEDVAEEDPHENHDDHQDQQEHRPPVENADQSIEDSPHGLLQFKFLILRIEF